jgi:hypothetical protein
MGERSLRKAEMAVRLRLAPFFFAFGDQGGRFLKKLPPLDPPAKTFYY